jgi:hypothetical protein
MYASHRLNDAQSSLVEALLHLPQKFNKSVSVLSEGTTPDHYYRLLLSDFNVTPHLAFWAGALLLCQQHWSVKVEFVDCMIMEESSQGDSYRYCRIDVPMAPEPEAALIRVVQPLLKLA